MVGKETDSKRIRSVQVYVTKYAAGTTTTAAVVAGNKKNKKRPPHQIRFYNIFFAVLYAYQLVGVIRSIGEPYKEFLLKAEREGFSVMEGTTRYRAELEHAVKEIDNIDRRTAKLGWTAWMDMDIEELAEQKRRDKERNVLDSLPKSMRVPGRYQTAFWPTLLLGVYATLHALVLLLQHWSVGFNVAINYREVDVDAALATLPDDFFDLPDSSVDDDALEGESSSGKLKKNERGERIVFPDRRITVVPAGLPTHARIAPAKGPHILVPVQYYPVLGMTFEYHRRRYIYDGTGVWSKIRCRTDFEIDQVVKNWSGFEDSEALVSGQIRFGPNMFQVTLPSFMDLYKKQLLNPFSCFQIFCVLLWAIDDYITYSLFSLSMVLTFEGVTVMQRIKSLQLLTSMGNPSRPVSVFRSGRWTSVDSAELLPGDILSLVRVRPHRDAKTKILDDGGDVVPADVLLLRGSTVVNEASLTGESVPQMKEGLSEIEPGEELSMKGKHKMNVAYAGTKMLQCKGGDVAAVNQFPHIPAPPDDGCVCFVLRTGFSSAQGKLVRMIEGSQEKVKGHERETGLLLLLLCVFAIMSSSYVLYHGIQNENRSKYELLLHCILIVTSVIRPELPMQVRSSSRMARHVKAPRRPAVFV
jgi:hypothetical protein